MQNPSEKRSTRAEIIARAHWCKFKPLRADFAAVQQRNNNEDKQK